jgi:hypothetical protein
MELNQLPFKAPLTQQDIERVARLTMQFGGTKWDDVPHDAKIIAMATACALVRALEECGFAVVRA